MAKSKSSNNNGGWTKRDWAFLAILVAGIAYIVVLILSQVSGGKLMQAALIIAAICALIAWTIVAILAWPKVFNGQGWNKNNVYKRVLFILCCLAILVCALLPPILM